MKANYVAHLGNDLMVANALRCSFGMGYDAWSDEPRTPRGRGDGQLIRDCAAEGHLLPFRHPHVTLACSAPLPVARQLGKHQVGMSWSETSRRYKTKGVEFHRIEGWRSAPSDKRQGSGQNLSAAESARLQTLQFRMIQDALGAYEDAVQRGCSPEQARFLLPQSMMVDWTWTGSLLSWAHLFKQRGPDTDSQQETKDFALLVATIVAPLYPVCWSALTGIQPAAPLVQA